MASRVLAYPSLGNSPTVFVNIINPHTHKPQIFQMLVDTGASRTCFPVGRAEFLGHNNRDPRVKSIEVRGVGGKSKAYVHKYGEWEEAASVCPECNQPVESGWKRCPQCGCKLESTACPTCGKPLKVGWKFCPQCPGETGPQGGKTRTNSLGMKFVPAGAEGVLFCVWETRVQDYQVFVNETGQEWPAPDFEQGAAHPAVNVSWDDATAFCKWLTEKERRESGSVATRNIVCRPARSGGARWERVSIRGATSGRRPKAPATMLRISRTTGTSTPLRLGASSRMGINSILLTFEILFSGEDSSDVVAALL